MVKLDTVDKLDEMGFFQPNSMILDIGCGPGYVPKYLIKNKKLFWYVGIDVNLGVIQHCRNICKDIRCSFKLFPIQSDTYNRDGKMSALDFKIPMADKSVDSVICHSLFTHLATQEIARHYINEINRVLKSGGFLWTTWFASPPNEWCSGTARTVYDLSFIHDVLAPFEPIYLSGGETTGYNDQLEIACVKG